MTASPTPTTTATTSPAGLLEIAHADPGRALGLVDLLDLDSLEASETAQACWAAGLAHRELGDLERAESFFGRAIAAAEDPELTALITSSAALVHMARGDLSHALELVLAASNDISGVAWSRNEMQRGLILQRQGDLDGALRAYELAEPGLVDDRSALVRLLNNRALAAIYRGDHEQGAADLMGAHDIAVDDGQLLSAASCAANLGFTFGRLGDIPAALEWFGRAETLFDDLGIRDTRRAVLDLDRAEVAAAAGLLGEARRDAVAAAQRLVESGSLVDAAEAELLAARLAMAAGDYSEAAQLAGSAHSRFAGQTRDAWSAQARFVEVTARSVLGIASPGEALALVDTLENLGWELEAERARIDAATALIQAGEVDRARRLIAASSSAGPEPAVLRAQRWHARALVALADGDHALGRRALKSGLAVLDEHRSVLGSPELRAHASVLGRDLIISALGLAVDSRRPWAVLETVESWRAAALHLPQVRPPDDAALAADLSALRSLDAAIHEAAGTGSDPSDLMKRRAQLESRIRRGSHADRGSGEVDARFNRRGLVEVLGSKTLVAFFRDRDRLGAVRVQNGEASLHDLAAADHVAEEVRALVFSLHRMAIGSGSSASVAAASASFAHAASELAAMVLEPMRPSTAGMVVVPTGVLHRLPWHALGVEAPVSVAPSVGSWLRSRSRWAPLDRTSEVVLAAGPGLPGARQEVDALARRYPNRVKLTGRNATSGDLLRALEGAAMAHLASHGTFRSDNPLFSALHLHDGPITVYDLERVRNPPRLVVMPSCDTAVNEVIEGDEILGLSAALLGMGVAALIAPVVPIPDDATKRFMLALHAHLANGLAPADSLAKVVAGSVSDDPSEIAVRSAFVALGA